MKHNFTPTQWETAEQKEKFFNQFVRFVNGGFKMSLFPKWFYQRLSMCFGHIAHYNQGGFYEEWFSDSGDRFLSHCLSYRVCGDPEYTYSDVEKELQKWIRENRGFFNF